MNTPTSPDPSRKMPGGEWKQSHDAPTDSQLFPILSERHKLRSKGLLIPGLITIFTVILLSIFADNVFAFEVLFASYLCLGGMYVVYQTCGKSKPIWLLLSAAALTALDVWVYALIRGDALNAIVDAAKQPGIVAAFFRCIFQIGIPEELIKSIPIFLGVLLAQRLASPQRERYGVLEPLDGVLLGAASASGFAFLETLMGYTTPDVAGLENLIRGFRENAVKVRVAYSACLGYQVSDWPC